MLEGTVAFTGRLASMKRADAFALVRKHGGKPREGVTRKTDVLVVGELGWPLLDDGRPSNSLAQAKTHGIPVASERQFLEWLGQGVPDEHAKTYTADQLASAVQGGDAKTQHDQQCEVNFYLGEHALLTGDKDEGKRLLGEAVNNCDHRFIEYMGAKAELARLAG